LNGSKARFAVAYLACCIALPLSAQTTGIRASKIFVEPFSIKDHSERLREDVITQLRKLRSVSIVPDRSQADAVMSGDGEIWIKGYRSLNPRSGKLTSNATPVYSGFLSVELKDVNGNTLWSYLVTPGAASENISKDLSKQLAKHLAEVLEKP
jgi:hypothetical protein